jgi:hypothetical protein
LEWRGKRGGSASDKGFSQPMERLELRNGRTGKVFRAEETEEPLGIDCSTDDSRITFCV